MKKLVILLLSGTLIFSFISCENSNKSIKRMQKLEENVQNPQSIEEIQDAIKKYTDRVNDIVLAQEQIGIWYKMLGSRYVDKKMYGEALKAYQSALEYFPANQNLYYWVGVCAGFMAKASLDFNGSGSKEISLNYIKLAEDSYKRAVELDERYERAWYGLGVIYSYEMDEYEKAVVCFEHALEISTQSIDTMFNLARAYYGAYEFDKSAEMYDKIISITKSQSTKAQAEELKKQALDAAY